MTDSIEERIVQFGDAALPSAPDLPTPSAVEAPPAVFATSVADATSMQALRSPAEVVQSLPKHTTFSVHTGDAPPNFYVKFDDYYVSFNETLVLISELPPVGRVEVWVSVWASDKSGRRVTVPKTLEEIESRTFARAAELAEALGAPAEVITALRNQGGGES